MQNINKMFRNKKPSANATTVPAPNLEMDLNSVLIANTNLYCVMCKTFLNIPIMLVDEIGNVCGRCFVAEAKSIVNNIRNIALENVIKSLNVPCRYKLEGCVTILPFNEIGIHEEYCPNKQYNCPSKTMCSWKGSIGTISKHFQNIHSGILIKSNSLAFDFDINLNSDVSLHKLLVSNSEIFLLQTLMENNNFWCAVCYIGDDDKSSNYEYFIEEIGVKKSFYFRHDSKKAILPQRYMHNLDKDRAIQIEIAPLKLYFAQADTLTAKLRISGGEAVEELDETLLTHLECPVCNLYMLPPIHQCITGHNICCKCRPKVAQCPTCRVRFENTRNYALEAVSAKTKYPCMNRIYGCMIVLPGSLIEKHELNCQLRIYSCMIQSSGCSWQGTHTDLMEHLKSVHKTVNSFQTRINYNDRSCFANISFDHIIVFQEVFKIGRKYDPMSRSITWNCRVFGAQNKDKFKYKVTFTNDNNDFMLEKIAFCLPYTNDEEFFNKNLIFPPNLTLNVGNIAKCKIIKL